MTEEGVWSFGYGSNMDVKALEAKKHVKIIDHTPAILPNYRMAFSLKGIPHVEPAYANIEASDGDEVHGVAFCMTKESGKELDATERGYNKTEVVLLAYDGRKLQGFVYTGKNPPQGEWSPSKRYLGVLCKGARQAGLKPEYIDKLANHETYQPPQWILDARKLRPDPKTLKEVTVQELAGHKGEGFWVSCLGYVVQPKQEWLFESHKGRDTTTRVLMQFHGIPMDDNDDRGKPPYPIIKDLSEEEVEYITTWLDHYQFAKSTNGVDDVGIIVGYLKEFKEQQESGKSTFKLPEAPQ